MEHRQSRTDDLPLTPADPASNIPLYHQVEQDLRYLINSGAIQPGDILPPEIELSQAYGVGRHTMRMALSRLTDDDLISRKAGRGTVVKEPIDRLRFYLDRSFTQQMAEMGRQARSRVIEATSGVINAQSPPALHHLMGAKYFHLIRLRFGDDEPIGLQSAIIVVEQCPDLPEVDFESHSLYDVLANNYKLAIDAIKYTVGATTADDLKSDLLQIAAGDPLLVINTITYVTGNRIIEHTTSYYRADRYEYSTTARFRPC